MTSTGLRRPHGQHPYGLQEGVASGALGTRRVSDPELPCAAELPGVPGLLPTASLIAKVAHVGDRIVKNQCR